MRIAALALLGAVVLPGLPASVRASESASALIAASNASLKAMEAAAPDHKPAFGERALASAKAAIEAEPKNAEAHLTLAIVYGKMASLRPPGAQMEFSRLIKSEAEEAVTLDPKNATAWFVLGRWNYEVATLSAPTKFLAQTLFGAMPPSSLERALEYFEKAAMLNPQGLGPQAELGRTLARLGRKDQARVALRKALDMPASDKDDEDTKRRAKQTLDALD